MRTAVIPFSGFCDSWHDECLDDALEQILSDSSGRPNQKLIELAYHDIDWKRAHTEYAKEYTETFANEFKLKVTFESLQSPREYNFTTDSIFVNIDDAEVRRLFLGTDTPKLRQVCREKFTSRSGFISFYSPDPDAWPPIAEWDHNQIGALIEAYVLTQRDGDPFECSDEFDLLGHWRGNGGPDRCLHGGEKFKRACSIAHYLCSREDRKYRFHSF